jgi:HD-GYP domain-containing protein (c-di-GMP phosphodiesterase class II)
MADSLLNIHPVGQTMNACLQVSEHKDALCDLSKKITLSAKMENIHQLIQKRYPLIDRMAVALYESELETLTTYVASSGEAQPLVRYQASIHDVPGLKQLMETGNARVVPDFGVFLGSDKAHTKKLLEQGYQSSYTVPLVTNDVFYGFVFFDSKEKDYFDSAMIEDLDLYAHLICCNVAEQIRTIRILTGVLNTANQMVHQRDPETAAHLKRMAEFSRLIAQDLAESGKYDLSDEYIELIFLFSGLHDIGKIGVPDHVLLKPDKLTDAEFETMKTHASKGARLIEKMIKNFDLGEIPNVQMLWNIAQFHHEKLDGSGYPYGLKDQEIPLEARIVAVADIFDALTTRRPYKEPLSNYEAFEIIRTLARTELDHDCVDALLKNHDRIRKIQFEFRD